MVLAMTPIEASTGKLEGAEQRTVDEGMFPFPLTWLPARGTRALHLQVVIDLMMDHRRLDAVQRPLGFGNVSPTCSG